MQASEALRNNHSRGKRGGDCVRHIDSLERIKKANTRWACAFGPAQGTEKLSLFLAVLQAGGNQVVESSEGETVLYVMAGEGRVLICGREFPVKSGDGVHIRNAEPFELCASDNHALKILMAVCPCGENAPWETASQAPLSSTSMFDTDFPQRVVSSGQSHRESTGDRFYKVLVGPKIGSTAVTQFIGSIPLSRAPEHFHLYEEVICVLSGQGKIWFGEESTPVRGGNLIFLPRRQPHCLECTSEGGMDLLGMFYPAGSPAINYSTENSKDGSTTV